MAIGTPIYTPKLPYLFAMALALGALFLDQKYDYFAPIKNTKTYLFAETKELTNKLLISSNNFFDGFKSSQKLAFEIDILKENIDLLSIENNFIRQNIDSKNMLDIVCACILQIYEQKGEKVYEGKDQTKKELTEFVEQLNSTFADEQEQEQERFSWFISG